MIARKVSGFTIMELMIWIGVVSILLTIFTPAIGKLFRYVNEFKIKNSMRIWKSGIQEFQLDTGMFPDKLDDLVIKPAGKAAPMWRGPYVDLPGSQEDWLPASDGKGGEIVYNRPVQLFKDKYKNYEMYSLNGQDADDFDKNKLVDDGG